MKNILKNPFTLTHDLLGILLFISGIYNIINNPNETLFLNSLIWILIALLTASLIFNFEGLELTIGGIYMLAAGIIFPWEYTAMIAGVSYITYYLYYFIKDRIENKTTYLLGNSVLYITEMINTAVFASILTEKFIGREIIFEKHIIILFVIIILESLLCITLYLCGLIERNKIKKGIKSYFGWLFNHFKECYDIYLINIPTSAILVIMYSYFGYPGLILASSFILILYTAFSRFSQAVMVEENSCTDTLSQVKNRKYYTEKMPSKIPDGDSIMFIDVNGLKTVNDVYGHDFGDEYIVKSSNILQRAVSSKDIIMRFGGDEFVIYIQDGTKDRCIEIIKNIESICESEPMIIEDKEIHVSMSIGIAISSEDGTDKDSLSKLADERMYANKHSGQKRLIRHNLY